MSIVNPTAIRFALVMLLVCAGAGELPGQSSGAEERQGASQARQDIRAARRPAAADKQIDREGLNLPGRQDRNVPVYVQPLEGTVDPDTYMVGPGDQFLIFFWSAQETGYQVAISPEGKMVIPTIGTLDMRGKTLVEARDMIQSAGSKKYVNARIEATLVWLRSVRVHVAGQVLSPGTFEVNTVTRVSDLIAEAGGLTSWGHERGIELRHQDGSVEAADLYQFKKHGILTANPFVRGGDVVFVPSIDLSTATVQVAGLVNDPGIYQITSGESLQDFLLRVDAFSRRTDLGSAYIIRGQEGDSPVHLPIFPYLKEKQNGSALFTLQDGDVIMIPERQEDVYVVGSVQYPGRYPYIPGLKMRDYIGYAGSMNQASSPRKARLIRKSSEDEAKGLDLPVYPGDTVFVPRNVEFGVREVAAILSTVASFLIAIAAIRR
jgi:protein involved in polysaccharide export with SLBB domain